MSTYILLAHWTEQGIRTVKDSPKRLDAAKAAVKALGGEIKSFFMTMGKYDFVVIYEAPDDAAAARFTLTTAQGGNLRSQTLKAFSETEYREIIGSLT
jgi:uncharacterized protein with GYD domain